MPHTLEIWVSHKHATREHLTNCVMASLARSVPLAWACLAALEAASLTAAGAGCQSGGPCNKDSLMTPQATGQPLLPVTTTLTGAEAPAYVFTLKEKESMQSLGTDNWYQQKTSCTVSAGHLAPACSGVRDSAW